MLWGAAHTHHHHPKRLPEGCFRLVHPFSMWPRSSRLNVLLRTQTGESRLLKILSRNLASIAGTQQVPTSAVEELSLFRLEQPWWYLRCICSLGFTWLLFFAHSFEVLAVTASPVSSRSEEATTPLALREILHQRFLYLLLPSRTRVNLCRLPSTWTMRRQSRTRAAPSRGCCSRPHCRPRHPRKETQRVCTPSRPPRPERCAVICVPGNPCHRWHCLPHIPTSPNVSLSCRLCSSAAVQPPATHSPVLFGLL